MKTVAVVVVTGTLVFTGCKREPETPGEALDRGIENTSEAADKAVDKTGEVIEKAGEAVEKTGSDMQK